MIKCLIRISIAWGSRDLKKEGGERDFCYSCNLPTVPRAGDNLAFPSHGTQDGRDFILDDVEVEQAWFEPDNPVVTVRCHTVTHCELPDRAAMDSFAEELRAYGFKNG